MKVTVADGRRERVYQLDGQMTPREHYLVRRISGLFPTQYADAFENNDQGLAVAFAVVAARRSGVHATEDDFFDLDGGSITFEVEDEPEDAGDPPTEPATGGRKKKS